MAQWVHTLLDQSIESQASSSRSRSCSIFRAPKSMRRPCGGNEKNDFDPELVSVGPFHHNDPTLQDMEAHKLRFLSIFLGNQSREERRLSLQCLARAMEEMEQETRGCYGERLDHISSEEFVQMMVLDGCFVLQLLCFYGGDEKDDPIFRTKWMIPVLMMDLARLENQLPIKVLERLLLLVRPGHDQDLFTSLALKFFAPLVPQEQKITLSSKCSERKHDHLLALIYFLLTPDPKLALDIVNPQMSQKTETFSLHCATNILCSNIKLKKGNKNLLAVELHEGNLELEIQIPCLLTGPATGSLLRNLVAYEQQCNALLQPCYITSYIAFLRRLASSPKDVRALRARGIVDCFLGSDEEVTSIIHNLAKDIVYESRNCYLLPMIRRVEEWCNKRYVTYFRVLGQSYFSSPWAFMKLMQAITIFYLAVVQTLFTVLAYNQQNK